MIFLFSTNNIIIFKEGNNMKTTNNKKVYSKTDNLFIVVYGDNSENIFDYSNIISIEGEIQDYDTINIDEINTYINQLDELKKVFPKETGRYFFSIELTDICDNSMVQDVIESHKFNKELFDKYYFNQGYKSQQNLIIKIKFSEFKDGIRNISKYAHYNGYSDCHILYLFNSFETVFNKNKIVDRTLADDIIITAYSGESFTIKEFVDKTRSYNNYANGDYWILFSHEKINTDLYFTKNISDKDKIFSLKHHDAIQIKEKNSFSSILDVDKQISEKIKQYNTLASTNFSSDC